MPSLADWIAAYERAWSSNDPDEIRSLFTEDALPWPPGKVKVVSVDALPPQLAYLKSGHVEVLLAQDCYGWGHRSVEILLDKIVKQEEPASPRVIDPLTRVTKESADEYGKQWGRWLKR